MTPNSEFIFSSGALKRALVSINKDHAFEDRETYVGASEVGMCMRKVVWQKLKPEHAPNFDAQTSAILELGHLIEAMNVKRVKKILEENEAGTLDYAGDDQLFLKDTESPLASHPDGIFNLSKPFEEGGWVSDISGRNLIFNRLTYPSTENLKGIFEAKSTSSENIKKWQRVGAPIYHVDQVQANMGLAGVTWGYYLATNRHDLLDNVGMMATFQPKKFDGLRERAVEIMGYVEKKVLPKGESERGFCSRCEIADSCPQKGKFK